MLLAGVNLQWLITGTIKGDVSAACGVYFPFVFHWGWTIKINLLAMFVDLSMVLLVWVCLFFVWGGFFLLLFLLYLQEEGDLSVCNLKQEIKVYLKIFLAKNFEKEFKTLSR